MAVLSLAPWRLAKYAAKFLNCLFASSRTSAFQSETLKFFLLKHDKVLSRQRYEERSNMTATAKKLELPFDQNAVKTKPSMKTGTLEGEPIQVLLPIYCKSGYKEETHEIYSINVNGYKAEAICRQPDYFISQTDPKFHLSVPSAINFICQVGIAQALFINGYSTKTVEVLMTGFSMNMTKQLGDPSHIPISMNIFGHLVTASNEQRQTPRTFYKYRYDINEGEWWGTVTVCVPFG